MEIPSSVKNLDVGVFHKMDNLQTLILSEGIENIPSIAFATSPNLTNIIPSTVTNIHKHAFDNSSINKMYCTSEQISSSICSGSNVIHYEKDGDYYIVYNEDGTIKGVYSDYVSIRDDHVVDSYEKVNELTGAIEVYNGKGVWISSYTLNSDGSISIYDANGKLIGFKGKRIFSVEEANALVSGNKNTLSIRYR